MTDRRLKIAGSSLLGVFARCTESVVLVPLEVGPADIETLQTGLEVEAVRVSAGVGSVLGSLVSANSNGFIVTHHAGDEELKILREHGKATRLPARINAAGNVILANDTAALVHPGLSGRACEAIAAGCNLRLAGGRCRCRQCGRQRPGHQRRSHQRGGWQQRPARSRPLVRDLAMVHT